jgi:hypothetical protein
MPEYAVQEIDLSNKRQLSAFIDLPEAVYRNIPQYVPPLHQDIQRMLDLHKNPFFSHSTAAFFLAFDQHNRPVARLACLNNSRYNEYNHEKTAFFYLFEALHLPGISIPLFSAAEDWARAQGLNKIIGPKGFSPLDGMGLLSEGFDFRPATGIPYNPPYYIALVEEAGFQVSEEIVSGFMKQGFFRDPKIDMIAQRVQERRGLTIARFRTKGDIRKLLPKFQEFYNSVIQGTTGNYPITKTEAQTMVDQLFWFADPSLIKVVMKDDQPVGFLFAYPDISSALQRSKGRLFPIGWLYVLIELRNTKVMDINGAGMIEEYRGSGGSAILLNEIVKSAVNSRYVHAEVVQISANNERMLQELSNLGITFHKKHRMYVRFLS